MDSCKYFSFLILIILPNFLFAEIVEENPKNESKYAAVEDSRIFLEKLGDNFGESWLVIPDGNGTAQFAVMSTGRNSNPEVKFTLEEVRSQVRLYLYTKDRPEGYLLDPNNLTDIHFNSSKNTKVLCHGWMASADSSVITGIRDAYLGNQDVNIIGVDWSYLSKDFFYLNSVGATEFVGRHIGSVINSLVREKDASYDSFHIIGHSLGAHIAGFAGSSTDKPIARVTGLDPALPGFQYLRDGSGRLDSSDAQFVDVIHTCAGVLGMSILVGHADFFPNGGSPFQPGCCHEAFPTGTQSCSHSRSHEYFAESIKHSDFKAIGCADWEHFKRSQCNDIVSDMGDNVSKDARGAFYLKTATSHPYALGLDGIIY